jgi:membrane associated rhomboid family serine protease
MGLYDRDYYHEEDDSQAGYFSQRARGQRLMVTNVVIVTVVLWILDNLQPGWLSDILKLGADLFQEPLHFYQLVTYGLTHALLEEPFGVTHIIFNMFVLWMFGRELELKYGRVEFLRFYIAAIAVAGFGWVIVKQLTGTTGESLVGASGGVSAVVFLYILGDPKRDLFLFGVWRMPAWVLGAMIAGIDLAGALGLFKFLNPDAKPIAYEAHLAGAAFGAAYFQFGRRLPRISLGDWRRLLKRFKPRPDLKLHDPETYYHDLDSEADALLAKIHKYGESSLTHEEKKKLEDYSRRMRQKHR